MTIASPTSNSTPQVEFWFEYGSNYSYLSVMRIEEAARFHDVNIAWKPFFLGAVFRALGMEASPFVVQKAKAAYVNQDMARQCDKYGLAPWVPPTTFPRLAVLPLRVALLGIDEPWIGAFSREVMLLNFVKDKDINRPESLLPILTNLGLPATDLLERAQSEPLKAQLRQETDQALAKGIFGAPTFFVGSEMFWGNDRMDDALAYASAHHQLLGGESQPRRMKFRYWTLV